VETSFRRKHIVASGGSNSIPHTKQLRVKKEWGAGNVHIHSRLQRVVRFPLCKMNLL
jgi:hypothetical protein